MIVYLLLPFLAISDTSLDVLVPLGSVMALNVALIGVLFVMARSMRSMVDTNLVLNGEIKAAVNERRVGELEREEQRTKIAQLDKKASKQEERITVLEREAEAMNQSIVELSAALKLAQEEVRQLKDREQQYKLELAGYKLELSEAQREIATLKHDNLTKDNDLKLLQDRVKELERKLQESEDQRARAETREKELLQQLAALQTEPGEAVTPTPEPSESEPKEGKTDG
jgi:chromosome segregation ATPase